MTQTTDSTSIIVSIHDEPRNRTIALTAWRYADTSGHAQSKTWREMGTPNSNGTPVNQAFVTGELVARWREGIVALRCADGYVYQFQFTSAPPPISGGAQSPVELWFTARENDTMQTMPFPSVDAAWDAVSG